MDEGALNLAEKCATSANSGNGGLAPSNEKMIRNV